MATLAPTAPESLFAPRIAFGEQAARYLQALPPSLPVIACDGTDVAWALQEAAERRRRGETFFVAPLLYNSRALTTQLRAPEILTQVADPDQRRIIFENLPSGNLTYNNAPFFAQTPYPAAVLGSMRELAQMADALIFRSQFERYETCRQLALFPAYVGIYPGSKSGDYESRSRPQAGGLVVFAPEQQARDLQFIAYALAEIHTPVTFVCQGEFSGFRHRFLPPSQAPRGLVEAAVLIIPDLADPARAMAFADRGFGLCVPNTSGAQEYLAGVQVYDPSDAHSILSAASRARGHRTAVAVASGHTPQQLQDMLTSTQPPLPANPPLVSIIIATYNRPLELRGCLQSIAAQDYPRLEVIVVNDAGVNVADVVAEFPFASYIENATNLKVIETCNVGFRQAKGKYLTFIADDDRKYPHQIRKAVAALLASGLPVAHSDVLLRLDTTLPDGTKATYGNLLFYENANDPTAVLWGGSASHLLGYLIDRELFAELGYLDPGAGNAGDCEAILKLSGVTDFAHVRAVEAEQVYRDDGTNTSAAAGAAHALNVAAVYAGYCPPDRPLIAERQKFNADSTAAASQRTSFFLPRIALEPPAPITR